MKPKITLGLPTYKGYLYIKESLDSIRNQTYQNFQLIISINGIDEETNQICQAYASIDPRIIIVYHNKTLSIWENWNVPLNLCETELFMWVSDDDILPSNYLENLNNLFWTNNSKAMIYGKFVEFENFPHPTSHKGNGIIYTFSGYRYLRKLKFLLLDPSYGKVNSLYGLGKLEWFKYSLSLNLNKSNIYDVGFVFDILDVCDIRFSDNSHFRRKFTREHNDAKWKLSDLHIFSDSRAFYQTIKNSKSLFLFSCFLFFPYVMFRSVIKTIYYFLK